METLKTSEALNENGVCVNLNKTLEKVLGPDLDVSVTQNGTGAAKVIGNVNHALDTEKRVAGTIKNGENCFEFGEICKGSPKYEAKGLNEIDACQLNSIASVNTLEVSGKDGNGISLFVDVFCPLEEFDQCVDSNNIGTESNFNLNGTVFHGSVENTSAIVSETKQELDTSNQERKFSMGDFVWAKFKTQLWWPGQICDPSNSSISNVASRSLKECFVIRYFGNGSFVQCASHKLKPFVEYFEQMSKQSNSRSFRNAVDNAVGEIGMRVKLEMTCSCYPIETKTESAAKEKKGETSKFGVNKFEPVNFLAYLKDLSKGVLVPSVIDSRVSQSQLSAYYLAMGHRQLSMDQLLPISDVANDKAHIDSKSVERKVCNGYELRERRKSMPLVVANHVEIEKNKTSGQLVGSDSAVKSQGKKSKKKRFEKPITEESSAKMLSELRFTALNCLYPRESKCFDVAFRYFSGFRKFSFSTKERTLDNKAVASGGSDVKQTAEICSTQKDPLENGDTLAGVKPKKRQREKKEQRISVGSKNVEGEIATSGSVIIDFLNAGPVNSKVKSLPKKRKKAEAAPASNIRDITTSGSMVIDFMEVGPVPASRSLPEKRTKKVTPASLPATDTGNGLLDLNVNVATNGPVILDFQKSVPFSPQGQLILKNGTKNAEGTPILPHIKEISDGSSFSHLQFMGVSATQGKIEPKKRKKKEESSKKKDFDSKSNVVLPNIKGSSAKFVPVLNNLQPKSIPKEATLPNINFELDANTVDIHGNNAEPVLLESKKREINDKTSECASLLPDLNEITLEPNSTDSVMPKSQPKKRSKVASNEVFDVNSDSTNKMGTALLLKFTDEFPLPSKETLVSTFSGFGQLKESDTMASSESCSAQVVFTRSCDARDAFLSLTKCSPFGPALVNYRLHDLSSALEADYNNNNNNYMRVPMLLPIDGPNRPVKPKAPRKPRVPTKAKSEALVVHTVPARAALGLKGPQNEAPGDIYVIRQKLEMMTSMMEKAGDNLAPQMRARLEGEINGLLNKIRTMSGSS